MSANLLLPESSSAEFCRICFDDKREEPAISACNCKGTIGLVHISCLQRWLATSNTHTCELCGYSYDVTRAPKYKVLYSILYWTVFDKDPRYHRGFKGDAIVFAVVTPLVFIGVYGCMVAADYYSVEAQKYTPAAKWTSACLLLLIILLTFAYYLWMAVTLRFHLRSWYYWWQNNNVVTVKLKEDEDTTEDVAVETASAHVIESIPRSEQSNETVF